VENSIMTIDRTHFPSKSDIPGKSHLLDEFLQPNQGEFKNKLNFRHAVLDEIQSAPSDKFLVKGDAPPGVSLSKIKNTAVIGSESDRRKLAVEVLKEAIKMDNMHDRKAEVFKLITLFSKAPENAPKEVHLLKFAKDLHSKPDLSPKDCVDAINHFEKPAAKAEEKDLPREEKVKNLLKKAQAVASPDEAKRTAEEKKLDDAKRIAERKKFLDEAAALYKDSEPMHKMLKKANPDDNNELDGLIAKIDRFNPMKQEAPLDPEDRLREVLYACRKEENLKERRKILEAFKNDDAYKNDETVKDTVDTLLKTKLTDLDIKGGLELVNAAADNANKPNGASRQTSDGESGIPFWLLASGTLGATAAAAFFAIAFLRHPLQFGWEVAKEAFNLASEPYNTIARWRSSTPDTASGARGETPNVPRNFALAAEGKGEPPGVSMIKQDPETKLLRPERYERGLGEVLVIEELTRDKLKQLHEDWIKKLDEQIKNESDLGKKGALEAERAKIKFGLDHLNDPAKAPAVIEHFKTWAERAKEGKLDGLPETKGTWGEGRFKVGCAVGTVAIGIGLMVAVGLYYYNAANPKEKKPPARRKSVKVGG
jgi:hypothetical protein